MRKFTLISALFFVACTVAMAQSNRIVGSGTPTTAKQTKVDGLRDDSYLIPASYVAIADGGLGCDLYIYTINGAPGYVGGNNGYGDKEKAQFFDLTAIGLDGATVDSVWIYFPVKNTNSNPEDINVRIYNGDPSTGPVQILSTSDPVNLDDVDTTGFPTGFSFNNMPFAANGFFVSAVLPTDAGDTVCLLMSANGCVESTGYSWENWSDDTWHPLDSAWTNLESDFGIIVKITFNVGINDPGAAQLLFTSPNPASANFNAAYKLYKSEEVKLYVYDLSGVLVQSLELGNQSAGIHTQRIDVSNLPVGMYTYSLETNSSKQFARFNVIR